MQYLTGVGARRQQWVITEHVGVAVGGALLVGAVHFTDRGVDIDGHGRVAGSSPESPGASEQLLSDRVELAHVTKGETAQERAQCRGCHHPMRQHCRGRSRAQHVSVVDAGSSDDQ